MPKYYYTTTPTLHTSKTAYTIDSAGPSLWSSSFQPVLDDRMTRGPKSAKPATRSKARTGRTAKPRRR
ncbi:MAG: hypothetical protein L0338_32275 [Acidobacteria bacterium]|nr:hypothetical protein [Nitrospiraceae bacterium]MCI0723599.1 hypothetical protein [Acidobacteriota bacterium]